MNILSVDTSTKRCFVALKGDDFYLERIIEGGFSPSEDLLHEIKDISSIEPRKMQSLPTATLSSIR